MVSLYGVYRVLKCFSIYLCFMVVVIAPYTAAKHFSPWRFLDLMSPPFAPHIGSGTERATYVFYVSYVSYLFGFYLIFCFFDITSYV